MTKLTKLRVVKAAACALSLTLTSPTITNADDINIYLYPPTRQLTPEEYQYQIERSRKLDREIDEFNNEMKEDGQRYREGDAALEYRLNHRCADTELGYFYLCPAGQQPVNHTIKHQCWCRSTSIQSTPTPIYDYQNRNYGN